MRAAETVSLAGATVRILVASRQTAGRFTVCLIEAGACAAAPAHTQHYEDCFYHVLDGAFAFQMGELRRRVAAGDSILIPRGEPYGFHTVCPGRLLLLAHPGGVDLLLRELGPADPARLAAILEKHGVGMADAVRGGDSM